MTQRLIVKFHPAPPESGVEPESSRSAARVSRLAADRSVALAYVRPMALGAHVVALDHPVPLREARAIARRLAGHAEVEYVQPDRRMKAQFVPNDQYLSAQTYLRDDASGISATAAWDVTTGTADVVVAVVDTGYRPHAAMAGRILPGYDFVSDPLVANDGDGRDADASDPGDWVTRSDLTDSHTFDGCDVAISSWHGTSTSGIIGANSNDSIWTAGINWSAKIFVSWFTYDLTGKAWWLVMSAGRTAHRVYTGTLFQGTGPSFDGVPFPPLGSPGGAAGSPVGTGTLAFTDADNGTFTYTVHGIAQTKAITRETFGPLPACAFGAQVNLALASNYQDLWWAAPAGSEAGWGINLAHEADTIFATWYTYDHDHTPMWLVTTAVKTGLSSYTGDLIRLSSGPPFNSVPFPAIGSPGGATGSVVGTATLSFFDGNSGTFSYTVDGIAQSKSITREIFSSPGTVCH